MLKNTMPVREKRKNTHTHTLKQCHKITNAQILTIGTLGRPKSGQPSVLMGTRLLQ